MSFWTFIAVIVVASLANTAFRHYQTQQTIRKAIQSGQTLDPATIERILAATYQTPPPRPGLIVGGVLMLAIGAGLALIGVFMAQTQPAQLWQGLGAGCLVGLIGVGMLVAAWLVGRVKKAGE